ncbi:MAG: hypothetical protein JSS10_02430 [Verrucomicrobia bacterium]|nr:hypothetical protein [Verrucomicrobiota bacterium]
MFRTLKEEIVWTRKYNNMAQLENVIFHWVGYITPAILHFSLGYKPLMQMEEELKEKAA